MKKVLILGGTRFFGKRLVDHLLWEGKSQITVATRGKTNVDFGPEVNRIKMDREDPKSLAEVAQTDMWDIVYDNICYSPDAAKSACEAFAGRTQRYILTSTLSVYGDPKPGFTEADFDPYTYPVQYGSHEDFSYGEGKRLAEAVFFQEADFPVAAMRIPIVLGIDDYTRRLHFHIEHVQKGKPIGMPNPNAEIGFINSTEAARFLAWLGHSSITGPVNAASKGTITLSAMMHLIETVTGMQSQVLTETIKEDMSPFGISESWTMDTSKAEQAGYTFEALMDWFPGLVREVALALQSEG
ncbi:MULTISPECIES: NAD-dependent epimerase/dehydratase family protein [Paenibacillus]|uniref:NAD-dependent dehydratase n=1 Tax=Paenibacillus taichungensis TaxID=484184 RepID=A0ABX2MRX0_9BACL|nr:MULTISPECIES: NAD-dependent epimerase/dehydratase family protein [Paenibacillus]NEU60096.1 NAD-dependent dehydratase [Paenibacillus sp. ALJ109b]NUU56832.1 NAD-dependent dehydratase [Paenibacillus taichungensis]PIH60359.1 NAD-dependent dehydratase [Paenibacillus sp. LK1]